MKILAIESSSGSLSCAVCEKENVLATFCVATGLKHSQTLMVLIEDMFKIAKIDLNQISDLTNGKVFDGTTNLIDAFMEVRGYN